MMTRCVRRPRFRAASLVWLGVVSGVGVGAGVTMAEARGAVASPYPRWPAGKPVPLATEFGPLGATDEFEIQPAGVADAFGRGPYDVFLRGHEVFPFVRFLPDGTPLYAQPRAYKRPASMGSLFTEASGDVFGVYATKDKLMAARLDRDRLAFVPTATAPMPSPAPFAAIAALPDADGKLNLFFSAETVAGAGTPDGVHGHAENYFPFNGAGISRKKAPFFGLGVATFQDRSLAQPRPEFPLFPPGRDFQYRNPGMTIVNFGPGRERDLVASDSHGTFHYFHNRASAGAHLEPGVFLSDERGNGFRHEAMNPVPVAIADPQTGLSNLLVGDTGLMWFYRFTGRFNERGGPIFEKPRHAMVEGALMTFGALPVITAGDVNGDGLLDLVAGNDAGHIYFVPNIGTPDQPGFGMPQPILAGGEPFRIQAGYVGIQGPEEAQWGYTCPTLTDWNGDGRLDLVFNSILAEVTVLLREPDTDKPRFEKPVVLKCDSLELHLVWRTQPAVTDWGVEGQRCIVVNDEENKYRMFWRIDDYNVRRGDVLKLTTGEEIQAHSKRFAGQWGRSKLQLVDWDRDGVIDLLVGTGRSASIPGPGGIPDDTYQGDARQASVLFLRNAGSNAAPVFEYPRPICFQGEKIAMGIHSCTPLAADWGRGELDLMVGMEDGVVMYYPRESLTWPDVQRAP